MENNVLTITVRSRAPQIELGDFLVADNSNYQLKFDFDGEWAAYPRKTARFIIDNCMYEKSFVGNLVGVPLLASRVREISVGVYAGELMTTAYAVIPVRDSILGLTALNGEYETAELNRVQAEAERDDAEADRVAAEQLREEKTAAVVQAETARAAAETARASAETERAANESARVQSETARVSAESARAAAEAQRASAESARSAAETERATAEGTRSRNESDRIAGEAQRVENENTRISNEIARSTAENARGSAESARTSAETDRASAETARAAAETGRQQAESARSQAETLRQQAAESFTAALDAYCAANDVYNVPYLIDTYGTTAAFRMFAAANAPLDGLTKTALRFFSAAAADEQAVYSTSFYPYSVSTSPLGVKTGANANLVCEPSTNSTAGRDDYAELPLFACFDCNYTIDPTTLEPVLSAVKGVYGSFASAPSSGFVGVLQMTGWVRRTVTDEARLVEYAASCRGAGFKPLPEAVRASDNSVRPFVIHAKYAAGLNGAGKLSSISGVQPVAAYPTALGGKAIGHDSQIALWREVGSQYCGSSLCDVAFLQLMLELKYALLGNCYALSGCRDHDCSYAAAASETGVKRVLLTAEQAAGFPLGSRCSVGSCSDRSQAACYDVCAFATVSGKESVAVGGAQYTAVNLDCDSAFDTAANATYITSQLWLTGSTDAVKGNDGSPNDNTSGKEPFRLQGIEVMLGAAEALADTTLAGKAGFYNVYLNRTAPQLSAGSPGGSDSILAGTITKVGSIGHKYIADLNWADNDQETYLLARQFGASSSTGYCTAERQTHSNTVSANYQWLAFGSLTNGAACGVAYGGLYNKCNESSPLIGCRACGTGGNRGVYTPEA